ncbi:Zinc finger, RING/FYVE/PHD-type [Moelleriella libera RCEF 2490]|uniref:Zinc finger, RING/FYVE/PHD-type n=1 Tax=Moelleriella libera RCEF 2490 TaxID=1081109 RepID=A0A166P4D5_9HYPO|nr:Zinc finger, RING/FYVE/PHD-type [Moelleriella libera RCEF 2490]
MISSNPSAGKSLSTPSSYTPQTQAGSANSNSESSRRPAQPISSASQPTPRRGQGSRKQHKNHQRPTAAQRNYSDPDDYDSMAELRAVRNPTSRRGQTSITHLLNYTSSRSFIDQSYHSRSSRRNVASGLGSGHHPTDKSRYVHSNYRFVVSPEGVYSKHDADADVYLDWLDVLQIIASSESQTSSCPICLSEPVAPRMAKCGHIFCLPCLFRFMNSNTDEEHKSSKGARWKKCPICDDTVYLNDVRPVRFHAGQESPFPRVGDDVVLRLMTRKANSTLALPREGGAEVLSWGEDVPWHYAANVLDYSRIMKGTAHYMADQFEKEVVALLRQEKEDELLFGLDSGWTQKAVKAIQSARDKTDTLEKFDVQDLQSSSVALKPASDADFFFYSAPPHLYLSPLDIRILKAKYGSFSAFPSTLLPRIEHISTGHVVDETLRKRTKYLGHLPRGCIISFLECDWTDIVPSDILETFSTEIEKRRRRNHEKAVQEERERLQAERLEVAAMRGAIGTTPRRHPALDSLEAEDAPSLDLSQFQPLATSSGATPPDPRPGFETLASMSTSPSTQRTVWGTRAVAGSPELEPSHPPVDDGWLKDEDFLNTAELSLQIEAIEALEAEKPGGSSDIKDAGPSAAGESMLGGGGAGNKKKKKKQKITLMSTGGRRGN